MLSDLGILFKRNIKLFLSDKRRMVTTFFSPLITVFIFFLFGSALFQNSIKGPNTPEFQLIRDKFADTSLLVGLLGMTTLTNGISLSIFMVQDSEKKIFNDLAITPIKTSTIRFSYFLVNMTLNVLILISLFLIVVIYMAARKTVDVISGTT
ncbi:UNVERIFIED_CONTAM: hypothetical protein O8I53_11410 [Campylobacter lari]